MRVVIALPFHGILGIIYASSAVLLTPFFAFTFAEILKAAGVSNISAYLMATSITLLSLSLSPVNVVIYTFTKRHFIPTVDYIYVMGIPIPIPRVALREEKSYLAINIGGAVVPFIIATYLLLYFANPLLYLSIAVASILIYLISKVIPTVGVVTPAFAPPIIALITSLPTGGGPAAAYIIAVYGTIIGADLFNLRKILKHRPPFMSIGGAGVFDGIFLSGVIAVILSKLF
ncbi:MAG: DUF1614 domain-containing protein [Pyrobaculum sp.]